MEKKVPFVVKSKRAAEALLEQSEAELKLLKELVEAEDIEQAIADRVAYLEKSVENATKMSNIYRFMDDIRTGKIIPMIAGTDKVANVTFS